MPMCKCKRTLGGLDGGLRSGMKKLFTLFALPLLIGGCVNTDTQIKMKCALGLSQEEFDFDNAKEYAKEIESITGLKGINYAEVSAFCKQYRQF